MPIDLSPSRQRANVPKPGLACVKWRARAEATETWSTGPEKSMVTVAGVARSKTSGEDAPVAGTRTTQVTRLPASHGGVAGEPDGVMSPLGGGTGLG